MALVYLILILCAWIVARALSGRPTRPVAKPAAPTQADKGNLALIWLGIATLCFVYAFLGH